MKRRLAFVSYGMLAGGMFALLGSAIFTVIVLLTGFWKQLDVIRFLIGLILGTLASSAFSVVPAAAGGAYLAFWLRERMRLKKDFPTQKEILLHGLLVGALAGLIACVTVLALIFEFYIDLPMLLVFALSIVISALGGWMAARWLVRRLPKFL